MDQVERVIVWDGTGQERVGMLAVPSQSLHAEEAHGRIVTLPSDARMFTASALGGVFVRHWGSGIHFTEMRPQRGCPMVLHVAQDIPFLHWAARVEPADKSTLREHLHQYMRGTLNVVQNGDPIIPMVGQLSATNRPVELSQLGEPDEKGGWFIRGKLTLRTMQDGLCPLIFQAVAGNLCIRWSAVAQSRGTE